MSFNLDDPLAGILSDGSDDSFFDDDILGKKKPTKKKGTPVAENKSSLFDIDDKLKPATAGIENKKDRLFELGGETKKPNTDDSKNLAPIASPAPMKRTFSKDSFKIPSENKPKIDVLKSPAKSKISSSADKIDILSELDKKDFPTKTLEKGKSSQSILDDILGSGSAAKTSTNQTRPSTAAKNQDFDLDSFLGKSESKPTKSTALTKANPKIELKEEKKTKDDGKKSTADWLGIFQGDDDEADEAESDMPPWLGVSDSKKKKATEKKQIKKHTDESTTIKESETKKEVQNQEPKQQLQITEPVIPKVMTSTVQSNEDITAESAALYLQQQESQLMVAMQLKAQEDRLATLQMRQKETQRVQREAALAHHAQLDAMLQRQAEQRLQMQAIISAHQQRISQRIKDLIGVNTDDSETNFTQNDEIGTNNVEKDSPYSKEKKQLLQLVQSLQENHDKEIDLMETSYRRQLAFLEVSLNQAEERMKEETDKLVRFYSEKIQWLEEHHQLYKKMTEENLNSLTERHKVENEMIRQQHLDNVKVLQEHHTALMENIKNAVRHEQVLIQDSAVFSSELHELVTDVKENRNQCQNLVDKVEKIVENTQKDGDKSLQVRESQINDMIQQLKKEREQFDVEKAESRDVVKMLETRLKRMTTTIEEDTAALKQKRMEFEFEKATFSKQTEFAKNLLKKQDEEIKSLRDEVQKEYQEKLAKIEEEKAKIMKDSAATAKEKASTQTLKQDLEKMKAELQAQLEEVTEQRSKLNIEKQQLHIEEQRILSKSRDYDLLAKTTVDKQTQADKKYAEAEFLQRKYEDRIRRIQEHVVSLNAREKQIAKEKVALSRERLNLHNERKQIENRQQCSLCKSTQYMPEFNLQESFMNVSVSRDYRNVDTAMNNIERDIASIVSKNYSLRHSAEVNSEPKYQSGETGVTDVESFKFQELMDPKFMMLRLDVQKVLSNLEQSKKENETNDRDEDQLEQ